MFVFSACSTVLVPARVAQALNLNLDEMVRGQPQQVQRFNAGSNLENGIVLKPFEICFGFLIKINMVGLLRCFF